LLVTAGLKPAVTPVGSPVTVRATLLPEPFNPMMSIALLAVVPRTRFTVLGELEMLKLGAGMANAMLAVLVIVPEVPITFNV